MLLQRLLVTGDLLVYVLVSVDTLSWVLINLQIKRECKLGYIYILSSANAMLQFTKLD